MKYIKSLLNSWVTWLILVLLGIGVVVFFRTSGDKEIFETIEKEQTEPAPNTTTEDQPQESSEENSQSSTDDASSTGESTGVPEGNYQEGSQKFDNAPAN